MLHLRNTLPYFFDTDQSAATLFHADIFSQKMVLKLNHPVPLKVCASGYDTPVDLSFRHEQCLELISDFVAVCIFHGFCTGSERHAG